MASACRNTNIQGEGTNSILAPALLSPQSEEPLP